MRVCGIGLFLALGDEPYMNGSVHAEHLVNVAASPPYNVFDALRVRMPSVHLTVVCFTWLDVAVAVGVCPLTCLLGVSTGAEEFGILASVMLH